MKEILFLFLAIGLSMEKFMDELSYTYPLFLETANYSNHIPNSKAAVILYYIQNQKGKTDVQLLNVALENVLSKNDNLAFYRVEGPYSPELIAEAAKIQSFPALAYYPANSKDIADVYSGDWRTTPITQWLNNLTTTDYTKKQQQQLCRCGNIFDKYDELSHKVKEQNEILKNMDTVLQNKSSSRNWTSEIFTLIIGIVIGFLAHIVLKRINRDGNAGKTL